MAKRLMAKVGTYTKDGQEKGEYVKIGVILNHDNGEYALIDPAVDLAGVALKQVLNGIDKKKSGMIIASVFEDQQQQAPQQGYQQPQQQPAPSFDESSDVPF